MGISERKLFEVRSKQKYPMLFDTLGRGKWIKKGGATCGQEESD